MKMIPTRTFLLKQDEGSNGKIKDIIAKKGVIIEITEKEAKKHAASLRPVSDSSSEKEEKGKKK